MTARTEGERADTAARRTVAPAEEHGPAADTGPRTGRPWRDRRPGPRADPYLLAGVFCVLYAVVSVSRYVRWESRSWDLGIFEQAVRSYAHLRLPVSDLKGPDFALLGDHFSPVTALIAPFYRVFPSPVTLLIAQAVLFAVAVVPVTRGRPPCWGGARAPRSALRTDCPGESSGPSTSTSTRSRSPSR
ncbi:DUF2079 domain-containing protein [Streptomyces sp. RFCAC02]|uniref:DUF2079 domain-containing protein n=1 Tax=Streptomyces sp. RFCAC02 TaxID=2499143 RepID=UPI003209AA5D